MVEQSISSAPALAAGTIAAAGLDGILIPEDLGIPFGGTHATDDWRLAVKPACARVFQAAHDAGLIAFLHWPGRVADILDELQSEQVRLLHRL